MAEEKSDVKTGKLRCTSCNVHIRAKDNFVKFKCPNCGKALIVRCANCKNAGVIYKCPECGFEGP
jgi:predicted RNA-binding Zn-ribbon protein involved in translation (DUF1610 family)